MCLLLFSAQKISWSWCLSLSQSAKYFSSVCLFNFPIKTVKSFGLPNTLWQGSSQMCYLQHEECSHFIWSEPGSYQLHLMPVLKPVFKSQVLEEAINSQCLFTALVLPPHITGFALLSFILTKEKALTGSERPLAVSNLYWFSETKFLAIRLLPSLP